MESVMIVAADLDDAIGSQNDLPWYLPADLRRFKEKTLGHVVIMGRKTYDSIIKRNGVPLKGRISIVISRKAQAAYNGVLFVPHPVSAQSTAWALSDFAGKQQFFIIGGASVYENFLKSVNRVELTRVEARSGGDVKLPHGWLNPFRMAGPAESHPPEGEFPAYSFETYLRK